MASSQPIRILLVDDHRRIHDIVSTIVNTAEDIKLVAQGSNGHDAVDLCAEHHPDIVLMDVVMPEMDGIAATRIIVERFPDIKVLVLSSYQDHESVQAMLSGGAVGYVTKGTLAHDLINTIRTTFEGKSVFSSEVAAQFLHPQASTGLHFGLTAREMEVLGLMAEGLNNGQIAGELSISQSTVKFHIVNILTKLDVETRSEALVVAAKNNLI